MDKMISIIIPVYNAQRTIAKCLDSILANTFDQYEIVLINDGSTDGSLGILRDYQKKYASKIGVINQKNQGVAVARNNGIAHAKSKYVMFVDNDDYVDGDYLERFVREMEKGDFDIVIGGYRRVTDEKVLYEARLKDVEWSRYMTMAPWAKIYRRGFIVEKGIGFLVNNIGEDVYFNLQAINLTHKISVLDYCGYNWFYNTGSVSNSKQKDLKNNTNVMLLLNSCYEKLSEIGVIDKEIVEFYFIRYVVWYVLFAGKKSDSKKMNAEFIKLFGWLGEKFPKFNKNKQISLFLPEGETLKNRVAVYVFLLLYRFKLTSVFLRLYAVSA